MSGLGGAGEVRIAAGGELTVVGGNATFNGALAGAGAFAVRDGAEQTLAGTGTFSGAITVSNATLLVESAATAADSAIVVQAGGRIGGRGTLGGTLAIEDGGGIVAGATPGALTVNGAVTLGAAGTVTLPPDFAGGRLTLLDATSVIAPDGVAGWQVEPAQSSTAVVFRASETAFSVSVFQQGTVFTIQ